MSGESIKPELYRTEGDIAEMKIKKHQLLVRVGARYSALLFGVSLSVSTIVLLFSDQISAASVAGGLAISAFTLAIKHFPDES